MNWLSAWHPVERAVVSLSGSAGNADSPSILASRFFSSAVRERTAGVIARKIPDSRFESLAESVVARNIIALSQSAEILGKIGPEVIPLKGLYLINRFYSIGERDLGDLDLLVRRERVKDVVELLVKSGFRPTVPLDRVLKASGLYLNSISLVRESSLPIHLHWHVVNASIPLFMVRIPVEDLWAESTEIQVAGMPARALAPHHLLVTISEHALKHSYEALIHLLDIDRVVRSGVDIPRSFLCARQWGVEPSLHIGLYLCRKMLGTPVRVGAPRGALARWIIRSMRENHRWPGIGSLGYLSMAKGLRQKARFLLGTFLPRSNEVESFGKRAGLFRVVQRGWSAIQGGRRAL